MTPTKPMIVAAGASLFACCMLTCGGKVEQTAVSSGGTNGSDAADDVSTGAVSGASATGGTGIGGAGYGGSLIDASAGGGTGTGGTGNAGAGFGGSVVDASAGAAGDAASEDVIKDVQSCDAVNNGLGVIGDLCCPANNVACAGHAQNVVLICDSSSMRWVTLHTCLGLQLCDSSPGPDQGSCQDLVPACVGQQPGEYVCDGADKLQCGPDLVTSTKVATCASAVLCQLGQGPSCAVCSTGEHSCVGAELLVCAADHLSYVHQDTCVDAKLCDATSGECAEFACPTNGGPAMVKLPQAYCIDSTEVMRIPVHLATHSGRTRPAFRPLGQRLRVGA